MALEAIEGFGPQAELIFIEGITKDKNPLIRAESAKGLGRLGVQNFRILLFGLRDPEESVRKYNHFFIIRIFFFFFFHKKSRFIFCEPFFFFL